MRWLRRHVRADEGTDPRIGVPAQDVSLSRLPPSSDFRLSLHDQSGAVISSIDLERGDVHDLKRAITQVMAVRG